MSIFHKTHAVVKNIIAGYGVYIDGRLMLVCRDESNAQLIANIYNQDQDGKLFQINAN